MHSRFSPITAIAVISLLSTFPNTNAGALSWFDGQEILIECPTWEWEASAIPNIEYELCFDDIDHCVAASIGDSVCIPSLGVHDVWVTAIDSRSGETVYYDGDIVSILRVANADFTGNGAVGFDDFTVFTQFFGKSGNAGDLDGDGVTGFLDFTRFSNDFGKCVDPARSTYQPC